MSAGVKRFIYASSLSVFYNVVRRSYLDEQMPPDGWSPYSLSKRLAEQMFLAGAAHYPKATILALRLMRPRNETDYQDLHHQLEIRSLCPLGPGDVRRLFLAALRCAAPGCHVVQASGDVENRRFPNTRVTELLGWRPRGD